jgi:hypothetical protein
MPSRRPVPPAAFLSRPLPSLRAGIFFRQVSMSRVPWHLFQERQPQAHLVVGALVQADGPPGGDELTATQSVLTRLVRKQEPAGDYAATVVRDGGHPEVYFAFEDEADARKLAAAVQAEAADSHPGWATQRAFQLGVDSLARSQIRMDASLTKAR